MFQNKKLLKIASQLQPQHVQSQLGQQFVTIAPHVSKTLLNHEDQRKSFLRGKVCIGLTSSERVGLPGVLRMCG